jgi:mannosyltransferase
MTRPAPGPRVIAPNLKRRYSGVTSTVLRLVPLQARQIDIVTTGPKLPQGIPQISLWKTLTLSRKTARVWHARRNLEMLAGLALKHIGRKNLRLLFTSAAQRRHTGYTKWLIRQMDGLVATSARSAAFLDHPAAVIPHGIDTETFAPHPDKAALRQSLGLDPDAPLIGCFGRIRPQKGTDLFVDAMIAILPRHPQAQAIIMGGVTEKFTSFANDLRARIDAAGLGDRIRILPEDKGWTIAPWFQAIDLYVAPQRNEGFGLTPLEAMSCGVPSVATRVGAFEEILDDGRTGTLIAPDDPEALAAAIDEVLGHPPLLAAWAANCRPRALAGFRIEDEANALIEVYKSLLARR